MLLRQGVENVDADLKTNGEQTQDLLAKIIARLEEVTNLRFARGHR